MLTTLIFSTLSMAQEVNLTYRSANLPSSWLDGFLSESTNIKSQNFGLEYVQISNQTNWTFYYEYHQSQIRDHFWDDIDDPQDITDGVYMDLSQVSVHSLGFQSAFEIPIQTPKVTTSFLIGGGLGIGILTGELPRWYDGANDRAQNNSGCFPLGTAEFRADLCDKDPDEDNLPIPVIPILDVSLALRIRYDKFSSRFMFGLHNMPYFGFALGYRL